MPLRLAKGNRVYRRATSSARAGRRADARSRPKSVPPTSRPPKAGCQPMPRPVQVAGAKEAQKTAGWLLQGTPSRGTDRSELQRAHTLSATEIGRAHV